ncbi:MAG TPA: hypothetical protein VN516_08005 [Candidatus Baltobacteraceae bacterium]|nr:hypothetical protein [Candidatus Baltobacteraceae bacterium]
MNRDEAKNVLLLYRTDADATDPQIAEALALAKNDSELSRWFEEHQVAQNALREKFRQIEIPGGLMQQIISEQKASVKNNARREKIVLMAAVATILISLGILAVFYLPRGSTEQAGTQPEPATLVQYESGMIYIATAGYQMDMVTNDLTQIRDYFARSKSPVDYVLPSQLEKTAATGCAVKNWNGAMVSMICFSTGKPLKPNQPGDLWLFVADHFSVKGAHVSATPQFSQINKIVVASWTQNGKLYLLATEGDEQTIRKYL